MGNEPLPETATVVRRLRTMLALQAAFKPLQAAADTPAKHLAVLTLIVVAGSSVLAAIVPLIFKIALDKLPLLAGQGQYAGLVLLIVAYTCGQWLARSLVELRSMLYGRTELRLIKRLGSDVFRHVMCLPIHFHLASNIGGLNQILANGLLGYRLMLHHILLTVLPVITELASMTAVLIILHQGGYVWGIALAIMLQIIALRRGMARIKGCACEASEAQIDANAMLADSTMNYETIKYFSAESHATARYDLVLNNFEERWAKMFRRKTENGLVVAAIFALCLGVSLYVAAHQVSQGQMSVGEFVLVHAYLLQTAQPLDSLSLALRDIAQSSAFIEKLLELLNHREEDLVSASAKGLPPGQAGLKLECVSFSYDSGRRILSDIDFAVPAGKVVAIVGASGSGKSSIIRLLLRLVQPTHGAIYLSGVPISDISLDVLRHAIAVVPQDVALFNDSIAYNIGIGKADSTMSDITRAAEIADAHHFISGLPHGYDTLVGQRGLNLSGGEKQRLAIARAAIRSPKVYVLDEATSSLDAKMEQTIHHNLMQAAFGVTTIIIAHRLSTITQADEILVLSQGKIIERGTHSELLGKQGVYSEIWWAQYGPCKLSRRSVSTRDAS